MANVDPAHSELRERLIWVINEFIGTWNKYPYLEQRTGISARKWQNVCNRVQQPTVQMIVAMGEVMPHFLSWLVLGRALGEFQVNPSEPSWRAKLREDEARFLDEVMRALKQGTPSREVSLSQRANSSPAEDSKAGAGIRKVPPRNRKAE